MKKALAMLLVAVVVLSLAVCGLGASALTRRDTRTVVTTELAEMPTFVVDGYTAAPGSEFTVAVRTVRNPGVVSFKLGLHYDATRLEVVSATEQDFSGVSYGPTTKVPFIINWCDTIHPDNATDGVIANVTFRVKADAPTVTTGLSLSYDPEDVYNASWDGVVFAVQGANVNVVSYKSGDVNGDLRINNRDVGILQQYVNDWDVTLAPPAAPTPPDPEMPDDGSSGTGATTTTAATTTQNVVQTTTQKTTNTTPTIIVPPPTTTTTLKTTKTTVTTQPGDGRPVIKILSIGHSFSVDAMRTYMWDLFDAAGYNATIGYLYYPGASLERQYHYVKDNSKSYQVYAKNTNGTWVDKSNACATDALWDEDWDIVTFQPSPDYGKGTMSPSCNWGCTTNPESDYAHFGDLVNRVRTYLRSNDNPCGPNTKVQFYYHLTWAFASDCRLWSFMYSDYDQMTMYNDFINATKKYILPNTYIQGVIPCITSVQNARTSFMGDTFNEPGNYNPNADGYHLNDKGDLVAAMTWVVYFTGKSAMDIDIGCKYSALEYDAICEAVDNAIKDWDSVTMSTYTED